MIERVDPALLGLGIGPHQQLHPGVLRRLFAQRIHVLELPRRVDMHQREGRRRGIERLLRQVQHHRAVLADRIEHDRLGRLGRDLTHDMDALGLEPLQVRKGS